MPCEGQILGAAKGSLPHRGYQTQHALDRTQWAGAPHRRLHHLRHTAGTIVIAAGMDPNTVQAILGHSTPVTALAAYGHVLKGRKEEAVQSIDNALGRRVQISGCQTKRSAKANGGILRRSGSGLRT
jgi:integrase